MQKPRLGAIEYIRGISMLGVIGIHVGSQYVQNPAANIHLLALLEIVTRFSVPIFFFISAFGMFYNMDLQAPFVYKDFLKRRMKTVLIPYVVWSLFYILHYVASTGDASPLNPFTIGFDLFFGTASYQLYFMVILLWFYLMMPLWVWLVRRLSLKWLGLLVVFQVVFNDYSCLQLTHQGIENFFLRSLIEYRMNYWVMHYLFIFVLGGYLAVHIDEFMAFMEKYRSQIVAVFWISMASLVGYYYWVIATRNYTALQGIFTAHQLCPAGIFYTIGASIFFFTIFTIWRLPEGLKPVLSLLGKHSYFMYLAHPVAITYLAMALGDRAALMTAPMAAGFYVAVVAVTLLVSVACRSLGEKLPVINELTIGVYKKKK